MVKARESLSGFQRVAVGDRPQETRHLPAGERQMQQRMEGSIEFCQTQATMGKGCHKQALGGTRTQHPRQEIGKPYPQDPCPILERTDQGWEKVFKGITIGEDETADAFWMVSNHQLTNGPSGIIADQGHLVEIECLQKIRHEVSHPKRAEIRIWMQGV